MSLGNLVKNFPRDPIIYGAFISKKNVFKSLVKQKYREMKDILIQKIVDSQEKNPEIFWRLLKNLKGNQNENKETSPIAMNEWETYFRSLHNVPLNKPILTNNLQNIFIVS